jgi:hypothetical protein
MMIGSSHRRSRLCAALLVLGFLPALIACGETSNADVCQDGALETQTSGDGCELCRCGDGEWSCEPFACVEPECPPPLPPSPECPDQASFSRDPDTGGCCRYENLCSGPPDWPSFNASQTNCEAQELPHCEPGDAVPAGDGCNECVCDATGELWTCSDEPCSPDTPPPGDACGFFEGGCPSGEYCAFNPPEACSHTDAPSVCRVIPEECTDDEGTVCGCDGKTYGNRCLAAQAGTGILDVGPCVEPRPEPAFCGGDFGDTCQADEFCAFDENTGCGENGTYSRCKIRPAACVEQFTPVCGCDGAVYANACFAAMAGVGVSKYGECA